MRKPGILKFANDTVKMPQTTVFVASDSPFSTSENGWDKAICYVAVRGFANIHATSMEQR